MSLKTKITKAKAMGIEFAEGFEPKTEEEVDALIDAKQQMIDQAKAEDKIRKDAEKKAADEAKKSQIILKDVDGHDVDQEDYFFPRLVDQVIKNEFTKAETVLKATTQTAPAYFNRAFGYPVDREELIEVFLEFFPRHKGFLFYKLRDREVYLIIVPLKYAKTISASNESIPGDFQRHALSFVAEGSVNIDSLRLKLARVAGHKASISTDAVAR